MPSPRRLVRNARLLLQSGIQHLVDDPALLVVQVSRRLPFTARVRAGTALRMVARRIPGGDGAAALGAFMAGDHPGAQVLIESSAGSRSRMRGEVAVLLDRFDLVVDDASPTTRARAAWTRGDLSSAVETLERAGQGDTRYARRLRSELTLLSPGYRLPVTERAVPASSRPAEGESQRVLHLLTNSLPHTQSGYSLRSHRILTALRDQGIESVALTRTGYPVMIGLPTAADEDLVDGIRYVRTLPDRLPQTQEGRLVAEVERALQLVAEFRPHVIHATTNYYNALVAQAVSAATGLPWVLEVRGLMEKTWVASHATEQGRRSAAGSEKVRLIATREAELAQDADAVVTLSATMAEELRARGVSARSIILVPNGVDEALFTDRLSTAEARETVGLGELPGFGAEAVLVGAVSSLVDYEGFDVLLRAFAHLLEDQQVAAEIRRRIRVVLAGDGVSRPALAVLAEQLGIADRVHLPGRVPREKARRWVEALDVVTVPRRDVGVARAVTPQKPIEAMALSRPVVASDLEALREAVTGPDGTVHAVLVTPGDPVALAAEIRDLIQNLDEMNQPPVAREMTAATVAGERAWPELVQRYRVVYENARGRSEGGGGAEQ